MKQENRSSDKFAFPFIMVSIAAIMYFFAFHEERDKVRDLNKKLEYYKKNEYGKKISITKKN